MFAKIIRSVAVGAAAVIALIYALGYSYLFKGIRETYLRGVRGATIDDGTYFPGHTVRTLQPIPWQKSDTYNKNQLPPALLEELKATETASLLVIRNGKLVHEQYWEPYDGMTATNSFSMAKAVTVMLTGIAIQEKKISNWNQKFSDFFSNYQNTEFGKHLTLLQLAQMEAGLNWPEDYSNPLTPNARAYYGKSLEEAAFLREIKEEPGKKFEYQSGATQLLGFALRKSLTMNISQYASEKLWQPLGMEQNAVWNTDDFGMEKTFCCLNAIPRDFAKLGQLILNKGNFNNRQLLDSAFVERMQTPTKLSDGAYGMGLWTNKEAALPHTYFRGLYGQYIIMVPSENIVIVRTGMNRNEALDSKGRPEQVEVLVREISKVH